MEEKPVVPGEIPCKLEMEPGVYFWCACGKSSKQPFCDGSHKGSSFTPIKLEITEKRRVSWCACKQTKKAPYCDGSHKDLA